MENEGLKKDANEMHVCFTPVGRGWKANWENTDQTALFDKNVEASVG
jgi:hypothetical protein